MSVVDYLVNSLLGICVVFFALALLIAIIVIMTKFNLTDEVKPKKAKKGAAPAAAPAAVVEAPAKPLAPGSAGDFKLYNTDPREAAMARAIVADELQKPINELRFLSIRDITPEKD